jgi:hypothetical protein
MIKTKADLYSIEETVTRPILIQVTNDIKLLLGLTNDIYTVYDPKDDNYKQKNKVGKITGQTTSYDEVVKIEFQDLNEDGIDVSMQMINPDYDKIYADNEIGSEAVPIYQRRKLNINFAYGNKSKSKVSMLVNKLRLMTASDSMYKTHNLEYSFVLPEFFKKLLLHIVTLKNIHLTPELKFEEYLNNTFDKRIDTTNTLDGNYFKSDIVIRERQLGVIGYILDDLQTLNSEFDEASGMYTITFAYEFTFEKPISLIMKYPVMVYSTMIDNSFRNFIPENGTPVIGTRTKGYGPMWDVTQRAKSALDIGKNSYYLPIPEEDTFILPPPPSFMVRLMCILIYVDPNNPRFLFNLKTDLPGIKFKDNAMNLLVDYFKDHINDLYNTIFYFELFKNETKDTSNPLILHDNGDLYTTYDMDIKSTYRVAISLMTDLSVMTPEARAIFKKFLSDEMLRMGMSAGDYESFLEMYAKLLSIEEMTLINGIKTYGYRDVMFNIKEPKWQSFYSRETIITLTGLMSELK